MPGSGAFSIPVLNHDLRRIRTFEARFTESVTNPALKSHDHHKGKVWIERPNRFRWLYTTPNREMITADGRALWIYDVALEQVTVRPMAPSLGATPAMLLAGTRPLIRLFRIEIEPSRQGLQWARLEPRTRHSEFRKIELGLRNGIPVVMTLWDRLGEKTEIRFSKIHINLPLNPKRFRFIPPRGVAVIGHP
ncbi:outer membrane lipoprotein carrier protein LolA [mine drainage metagenome]|uniref:Outer-membrane lipoprotein carrier protein n=1 Tax=mine drainage metagenome TaxID=410659 RepID=T0XZQ5_9ZZZZ